jgi:DNA-binding Lrp family transcriptional regulator
MTPALSDFCGPPAKVGTLKRALHPPTSVTGAPLQTEALDLDMLREMYRGGAVNLAGVDPRLNATRIAQNLKVGRTRVVGRLRAWNDSGFLRSYDVWLNPALFGWQGAWLTLRVDHPRVKPKLLERLALLDGAVSAMDFIGEWVSFALVSPDDAALERTVDLVRGLSGVGGVDSVVRWRVPTPQRDLTTLDIRIVRALRERPTATLSATARRVGISTRTMTRRYSDLVEDWAVWFVPIFDFRAIRGPVVSLSLQLRTGAAPEPVVRRIRSRFPLLLEFATAQAGPELEAGAHVLFVMPPSAAHLEELERLVESIDGIAGYEATLMVQILSFPEWFDRHLETLARPPR